MFITDIIRLWSTVSVFYVKFEVDFCPAKRQFDFWPSAFFSGCSLTFILTEDEDWSTEYIRVSPPCIIYEMNVVTYTCTYENNSMDVSWIAFSMPDVWWNFCMKISVKYIVKFTVTFHMWKIWIVYRWRFYEHFMGKNLVMCRQSNSYLCSIIFEWLRSCNGRLLFVIIRGWWGWNINM